MIQQKYHGFIVLSVNGDTALLNDNVGYFMKVGEKQPSAVFLFVIPLLVVGLDLFRFGSVF